MARPLPAFRYHGAKFRIAHWLIGLMPPHQCYVEAFGGAAGVLLHKPRCYAEVYNDLDGDVVNYFRVLRDPVLRAELLEAIALTPYAREEFEEAFDRAGATPVERARRLAVRAQMGFGSAGATKGRTGFRLDTRRKYGTNSQLWATFDRNVTFAAQRFQAVVIENRPAVEVLVQHDADDTLHLVDPPYLHETRVMRSGARCYAHEMTNEEHEALLDVLLGLRGMVMVCGYRHDLYMDKLAGWELHTTQARAAAGRGTVLREEHVWLNPQAKAARGGHGLFSLEETTL